MTGTPFRCMQNTIFSYILYALIAIVILIAIAAHITRFKALLNDKERNERNKKPPYHTGWK